MPRTDEDVMSDSTEALTMQFLAFVAEGGRAYGEVMEAWRTSCPRMSIWEDALIEGLVQIEHAAGASREQSRVTLTVSGRARLLPDATGPVAKGIAA
jgi:hypothetical protein